MKRQPIKVMYTLVRHSGFGYAGDRTFEKAVESRTVRTKAEQALVTKEGGVLYEEYIQAEDAGADENYPGAYRGMIPVAQGTFSEKRIDGLHIYIPPKYEEVHTGHLRGREEDDGISNEEKA